MALVLQIICAFLFAVGALFILIDVRSRFDRSFRFFGVSLILLCAMVTIDLWVTPGVTDSNKLLFWQRLFHFITCVFISFSVWYLLILTSSRYLKFMPVIATLSLLLSTIFLSEKMLIVSNGILRGGILYNTIFVPFVLAYVLFSNYIIIHKLIHSQPSERKILIFHLVAFIWLCICGILDMASVSFTILSSIPSMSTLGVLGYGLMGALIFTERFLMLLSEKENSFSKLESAYKDLEQVNALKQLGESTAIINHEIKNYMFMISGNAQVLQEVETLSEKGKAIVKNIVSTIERLTLFSDDILKLSRTSIILEKHPLNLSEVIMGTIDKHFLNRRRSFSVKNLDREHFIYGDWGKLEQVFLNAFKNSFEASSRDSCQINVKISTNQRVLVVSIEDNGTGCNKEQMEGLFKAFYTTKKSTGGTGLGMSITRTIVESHGGKISAYSKNMEKSGEHGMKLIMTFPAYAESMLEQKHLKYPIVIIKEGMENLPVLIRVFQNLAITPYIVQEVTDLNENEFPMSTMTVIVGAKALVTRFKNISHYPRICIVSQYEANLYILDHGRGNRAEIFSEEYVLSNLIHKRHMAPRSRLQERKSALTVN
jgi:signal transduction histidine kinase